MLGQVIRIAPALWLYAVMAVAQATDLYERAARLYSQEQFEQAEQTLRQVVRRNPHSAPAYFLLGATLLRLHRNTEAIAELRKANQLDPRHRDAAKLLAAEYVGDRRFAEAIGVLKPLLGQPPVDEETYLLLIQVYQDRGDAGDAEEALQLADQALAKYPGSAELILWKGAALRDRGRLEEARKLLQQVLRLDPGSLRARAWLADVLNREGKHAEAAPLFRAVLEREARDIEARIGLSRALMETGRAEEALFELQRAKEMAPENPRIRLALSQLYSKLGRPEQARKEAEASRRPAERK